MNRLPTFRSGSHARDSDPPRSGTPPTVPVEPPQTQPPHAGPPQAQPPGTGDGPRLGPYTLRQRLGEGGMGVVHLATDDNGRAVALKVLRDHVAADPDARIRLAREVTTLGRVRHPQVAAVLGADVGGERPYVVTRYVPGPPLDEWVRHRGPLRGDDLVRLGRGLADALGAIHDAGVVHRDLKPGNVLMLDGSPVLIDFGIAHVADEVRLTRTGLVIGTPGYLPPELLDGSDADTSTDWWAWAATLTFAATGRPPFGRGPMDAVFHRVYRGEADLDGVDPRLRALLRAALDPQPTRRPGQEEILAGLGAYAAGGDSGAVLPAAPEAARADGEGGEGGTCGADAPTTPVTAPAPRSAAPETSTMPRVATRVMPRVEPSPPAPPVAYAGFHAPSPPAPVPRRAGAERSAYVGSPAYGERRVDGGPPAYDPRPGGPEGLGPRSLDGEGAFAGPPRRSGAHAAPGGAPRRRGGAALSVVGLLALLVALAVTFPVYAVLTALACSVLARTVDASMLGLYLRRAGAGPRGSDIPVTVLAVPLRLVLATVRAVVTAVFGLLVGAAALVGSAAALSASWGVPMDPLREMPLAVGMTVALLLGWWGPGGGELRRGTRGVVTTIAPTRWGPTVLAAGLFVAAAYLALRSQATGVVPDLTPLEDVISTTSLWW